MKTKVICVTSGQVSFHLWSPEWHSPWRTFEISLWKGQKWTHPDLPGHIGELEINCSIETFYVLVCWCTVAYPN